MSDFGNLEECRYPTAIEQAALDLGRGVIISFVMYNDGQTAHSVNTRSLPSLTQANYYQALRNHEIYKVTPISGLASPRRNYRRSPEESRDARDYCARYEIERKSIFVGGLASGTTEVQVRELFDQCGRIVGVSIREMSSKFER